MRRVTEWGEVTPDASRQSNRLVRKEWWDGCVLVTVGRASKRSENTTKRKVP